MSNVFVLDTNKQPFYDCNQQRKSHGYWQEVLPYLAKSRRVWLCSERRERQFLPGLKDRGPLAAPSTETRDDHAL